MSFSSEVKRELEKHINNARHCRIAEMAAYVLNISNVFVREPQGELIFRTDNQSIINKIQLLIRKTYDINCEVVEVNGQYEIVIAKGETETILQSVKMSGDNLDYKISHMLLKNACCKRAYLQGTFVCSGSMTSPEKGYHLEYVSSHKEQLEQIQELIKDFDIDSKITSRKKNYVLYVKEGAAIVDLLNIMGAHVSLMNMENAIILKDMRNDLNRKVNCETANIIKSINAASKQVEDIKYIQEQGAFGRLPDSLKNMAKVRLANPDTPLKDLGSLLDPPVGKSGVNHRLRRLSEIAEEMRQSQ